MKKHLIALAVASAVASPVLAQNVSVYGIIDAAAYSQRSLQSGNGVATGVEVDTTGVANASGLSSSRLGFRGTEDLGGGMKANFTLEAGLDTQTNMNPFSSTRAAWAGLSGSFGEFRLGRQDTLGKSMQDGFTAFGGGATYAQGSANHTTFGASTAGQQTAEATLMRATIDRHSNTLTYIAPEMSGLKLSAQAFKKDSNSTGVDGKATNSVNNSTLSISANGGAAAAATSAAPLAVNGFAGRADYSMGSLSLAAAYSDMDNETEAAAGGAKNALKNTQYGVTYTAGAIKVFGLIGKGSYQAEGAEKSKATAYDVGATYTAGATTFLGSIGKGSNRTAAGVKTAVDGYQVQARYALSSRTTAYALYHVSSLETDAAATAATDDKVLGFGVTRSNFDTSKS